MQTIALEGSIYDKNRPFGLAQLGRFGHDIGPAGKSFLQRIFRKFDRLEGRYQPLFWSAEPPPECRDLWRLKANFKENSKEQFSAC
jgi:hypothetical protein